MRFLLSFSLLTLLSRPDFCSGFLGTNLRVAERFPFHVIQSSAPDSNADFDEMTATTTAEERFVDAIPTLSSVTDPEAVRLRDELVSLANATNRGFSATKSQKKRAKEIIFELAKFNPTGDPAAPYYTQNIMPSNTGVSLAGKWDLIFTDAPDITSLDTSRNPLATAQLGRIGQECTPPLIKNVIEWKKPEWIDQLPVTLPFSGDSDSRVLQKVCTQATASPDKPMLVDLKLVGIDLVAPPSFNSDSGSDGNNKLQEDIERDGLPVGFLKNNPLELRGPLTAPFGQFEVLYLDEEMRIVLTRGYVAVNLRCREEWF